MLRGGAVAGLGFGGPGPQRSKHHCPAAPEVGRIRRGEGAPTEWTGKRMDSMHEKKARLGRGLDALLGGDGETTATGGAQTQVPVEAIEQNPHQPRKSFDDDDLAALSASIRAHGVLQPLVVRQVGDRFQLVAGERRLRAARAAGLGAVPVTVVDFNDQQVLEAALVENIQRADLKPIEKAQGFKEYLTRYEMTHEQLVGRLCLGRATITNLVALLDLPGE